MAGEGEFDASTADVDAKEKSHRGGLHFVLSMSGSMFCPVPCASRSKATPSEEVRVEEVTWGTMIPDEGGAPPFARGEQLTVPSVQEAAGGHSELALYFLGDYSEGMPFCGDGYEEEEALQGIGVAVLRHAASGIFVSQFAVDLRSASDVPCTVVFHYTTQKGLADMMSVAKQFHESLTSVSDEVSHFGKGLYAATRSPDQFGSKRSVLLDNHWPRCRDSEVPREYVARRGGGVGSVPADPPSSDVCSTILDNPSLRGSRADCCVPILVDCRQRHDSIWLTTAPDLQVPLGYNCWGELLWPGRDVPIVVLQECQAGGMAAATKKADVMRRRARVLETTLGEEHPSTLTTLANLSATLSALGRDGEAEPLESRILEASKRTLGNEHPRTLHALGNLAATLSKLGRDGEAEPLKRTRLEVSERILGKDHPSTLRALGNLAATLSALGRDGEAEHLERRRLEVSERTLGKEHPQTLRALGNLAATLSALGRIGEAEPLTKRVLEVSERILGKEHPQTLIALNNLAAMLPKLGRHDEAEPSLKRVLEVSERTLGKGHPMTLKALENLAKTLRQMSRYSEALQLERDLLERQQHCR